MERYDGNNFYLKTVLIKIIFGVEETFFGLILICLEGRDSVVGIAPGYELDDRGLEFESP
jgi:hypothetical protein